MIGIKCFFSCKNVPKKRFTYCAVDIVIYIPTSTSSLPTLCNMQLGGLTPPPPPEVSSDKPKVAKKISWVLLEYLV